MKQTLTCLFIMFLAGCIGAQKEVIQRETFQAPDKVTYTVPKNDSLIKSGFHKGLTFPSTKRLDRKYTIKSGISTISGIEPQYDPSSRMLIVTKYNGDYFHDSNNEHSSFVRYQVKVDTKEQADRFIVTFTPISKEAVRGCGPLCADHYSVPDFPESELIRFLCRAIITINIEIDSPYNTDSTYANFRRLLKEEIPDKKLPSKIQKTLFIFAKNSTRIRLSVEVFPYRNGSKAVINAEMPVSVDPATKTGDVEKDYLDLKSELEKIVKN